MPVEQYPIFSVGELNQAIGNILSRGFAARFQLNATISKAQLKNGHMWLTLTDGEVSIPGVIWASTLQKTDFRPKEHDGVEILGKLNFWNTRATLSVQIIQIRPSISTVMRKFERVKNLLLKEGLIDIRRHRKLPNFPLKVGILTSSPSSALADMLKTAQERWPLTKLLIFPIPVQGEVGGQIERTLNYIKANNSSLHLDQIVLARGGGSREDLMIFDDESICRILANFPIPIITGLGHEDDLTVADLVADHRASTPTAAMVDILPSREMERNRCLQINQRFQDHCTWILRRQAQSLLEIKKQWSIFSPINLLKTKQEILNQKSQLLDALSPDSILMRGFCILTNDFGKAITSLEKIKIKQILNIQLIDGSVESKVTDIIQNQTQEKN